GCVMVSSSAAAGPAAKGRPLTGAEPPSPVTAYGRSKLAAEQAVTGARLAWSILRPPMVYGPRDREVLKVFRLARLGVGPVMGDGTQELTAVHAADLRLPRDAGSPDRPRGDLSVVPDRRVAIAVQSHAPVSAPPRGPRLLPVDRVLLGYLTIVAVIAARRAPARPECWWVVAANLMMAVLIALVTRPHAGRVGRVLREIYPLLLLVVLYGQLDVLNGGGVAVHDALVQRWELSLF